MGSRLAPLGSITMIPEWRHVGISRALVLGRNAHSWIDALLPPRGETRWADSIRRALRRHGSVAAFSQLLRDRWSDVVKIAGRNERFRKAVTFVARALGADPKTGLPADAAAFFEWEDMETRDVLSGRRAYTSRRAHALPRYTPGAADDVLYLAARGNRTVATRTLAVLPGHRPGRELRIAAVLYGGRRRLDIREWVSDRRPGEWRPTRDGVVVEADAVEMFVGNLEIALKKIKSAWADLERLEGTHDRREAVGAKCRPDIIGA